MMRLNINEEEKLFLNLPDAVSYIFNFEHIVSKERVLLEVAPEDVGDTERFKLFLINTAGFRAGDYLLNIDAFIENVNDEPISYFYRVQLIGDETKSYEYNRESNKSRSYER